ncbi:MAG: transcription elongation factor GreA [Clostridia bacterium]|nr:transcription elongation factor GreA [Clostridia bacterium]
MTEKVLLTAESKKQLENRLNYLKSAGRAEMAAKIEEARSFGDLSENAEYDLARDEQAKMEREISELENKLHNAEIIDTNVKSDTIGVGNTVIFADVSTGAEMKYTIVGSQDSDPFSGKISNESPIGKALVGASKGDTVSAQTKNGVKNFKIISIE